MELLLVLGILAAIFVGINIGGSSTGVAFGPSFGSRITSKAVSAFLMTVFVLAGGYFVGKNVVATMGGEIVSSSFFTPAASVVILFFVGAALLLSNLAGVPASTSMTAVGAIAGLGVATNSINWEVMGRIVSWWFVAPVIAFWLGAVIGRYAYPHLDRALELGDRESWFVRGTKSFPFVASDGSDGKKEAFSSLLVLGIGCFMAFSAGASNVANAVAPLVGSGALSMKWGVVLAVAAIGIGAFTIARRTLDTVGEGITDLPLLASLIVSVISASIITALSWMGIPVSLAISSTMCIAGLGWGRASRTVSFADTLRGKTYEKVAKPSLKKQEGEVKAIGEEKPEEIEETTPKLFDPSTFSTIVSMWIVTPTVSATASFVVFAVLL